ncbi:KamA family radical SAM protein [Methylothermus subterraneus]
MPLSRKDPHFKVYTFGDLVRGTIPGLAKLSKETRFAMQAVARVLPFRVNAYVVEELIDWDSVPEDPIFQLTFPQPGMLALKDFAALAELLASGASEAEIVAKVQAIRQDLNPHPAGQLELNVARDARGDPIPSLQHKYRRTVLFFPSQGQTCHSYCSFCFRWPQFVGDRKLRIASREAEGFYHYLRDHPEVTDVLITGGDPLVMQAEQLAKYLLPLLAPQFEHVQSLRIGTKSLSFWPYRYLSDKDADDLLRIFEKLVQGGKHLALMAHYNHPRELETEPARRAIARVRATGAVIRAQGPLLAHVNDDPKVWATMWQTQVKLGIVPYYLFVGRDTGAWRYFQVPLARCWEVYRAAVQEISGLGRTVRGPVMSVAAGKVEIQGVTAIGGEKVFVLRFLQARDPALELKPFFARFDPQAVWLDQLRPALGEERFFFEVFSEPERIRVGRGEKRA